MSCHMCLEKFGKIILLKGMRKWYFRLSNSYRNLKIRTLIKLCLKGQYLFLLKNIKMIKSRTSVRLAAIMKISPDFNILIKNLSLFL